MRGAGEPGAEEQAKREDEEHWAVTEFAEAELGDVRRRQRVITVATQLAQQPGASFAEACGSGAALKATYRLLANEAVAPEELLASHVGATYERALRVPVVLAVQDTTELDWTRHPATRGLGPLGSPSHQGLMVHTTVAFTPERVPLGLLAQEVWARDPEVVGQRATRKQRPLREKESRKWLQSVAAVNAARQECPATAFVSVGDREADVYDLFVMEREAGVNLLVRAAWDRRVAHEERYLWATVLAQPATEIVSVSVPRHKEQPARTAVLMLRYTAVELCPPCHRRGEGLPSVTVWAVHVVEEYPPVGIEPLEWLLLTTCAVTSGIDAQERVEWYACRFGIEVWHKVLKSGCRIEARQLESADRLQRCLTLFSVIAWRILYATMLSRTLPELPCTVLLALEEWQALYCATHHTPTPPPTPPTLQEAVRWIARLGGFLGRPGDGVPGVTVLWRGFQHLADLTRMYCLLRPSSLTAPNVGKG
jgi:Transposase DNA-binding/Transposase Tn5 dimerisation domain